MRHKVIKTERIPAGLWHKGAKATWGRIVAVLECGHERDLRYSQVAHPPKMLACAECADAAYDEAMKADFGSGVAVQSDGSGTLGTGREPSVPDRSARGASTSIEPVPERLARAASQAFRIGLLAARAHLSNRSITTGLIRLGP